MYKKTIKYVDYNGNERKEDFYFNLTKTEIIRMETGVVGGLTEAAKKARNRQDIPTLMNLFEELILESYGEKSADGRQFIKSKELSKAFSETEAYVEFFMMLVQDPNEANAFVRGVMPKISDADYEKALKEIEEDM